MTVSHITQAQPYAGKALAEELVERIIGRLGFNRRPTPTIDALRSLYSAWCERVPFDNVRKLIHVRAANAAPLPGSTREDFFEAWLKFGAGGTYWPGAGALHALLVCLGFDAVRGVNRGDRVFGVASGHSISILADGSVTRTPLTPSERRRFLVEEVGIAEALVMQLPDDVSTPPPPWSQTAQALAESPG